MADVTQFRAKKGSVFQMSNLLNLQKEANAQIDRTISLIGRKTEQARTDAKEPENFNFKEQQQTSQTKDRSPSPPSKRSGLLQQERKPTPLQTRVDSETVIERTDSTIVSAF